MEFSQSAMVYLKACNLKICKSFFRSRILSHPDYPALTSLTDTLDEVGIKYSAFVSDKKNYAQLNYPLFVHTIENGKENFKIVKSISEFEANNYQLKHIWDGNTLAIESGYNFFHEEHSKKMQLETNEKKRHKLILFSFLALATVPSLINFNLILSSLALCSITGILISTLIVLHSMGKTNVISKQLCSADENSGCNKIIKTNSGKGWENFGLGDVGIIYFMGTVIFINSTSILKIPQNVVMSTLIAPFFIGTILSILSIYYQWKIAKTWCRMCLIVVAIVNIESLILFYAKTDSNFESSYYFLLNIFYLLCFYIPLIPLLLVKSIIIQIDSMQLNKTAVLKWKRNPDIFFSLLEKQNPIYIERWENDIIIGSEDAAVNILIACNPYCSPCAAAHKVFEAVVQNNKSDIALTIRFVADNENVNSKKNTAIKQILQANNHFLEGSKNNDKNPVDYWFEMMDLEKFKSKYKSPDKYDFTSLLAKHAHWSIQTNIKVTPTIFINGYLLPKQYNFKDIPMLMPQIIETYTLTTSVYNEVN